MLFRTILITHNSDYCIIQESVYFLPVDGGKMMLLDGEVMKEKTEIILLHLLRLCSLSYCLHLSYYYHNLVDTKTIIMAISRINC